MKNKLHAALTLFVNLSIGALLILFPALILEAIILATITTSLTILGNFWLSLFAFFGLPVILGITCIAVAASNHSSKRGICASAPPDGGKPVKAVGRSRLAR